MVTQTIQPVLLDAILKDVTVIPSGCSTFITALEKMVTDRYQSIFYEVNHLLKISEIDLCKVIDGKRYIDIEINQSDGDIVSHFDSNMKHYEIVIGTHIFSARNRIVVTRCQYIPKFFRIFIDDDKDTIYLSYRVTILNNFIRHQVLIPKTLVCDGIRYSGGITVN